ncbi:MAG: hypothetical protein ACRC5T_13270 [Cetobacterium sp.]
MKIVGVLKEVYSRKQDVNRFLKTNELTEDSELSMADTLMVIQNMSNKDKRKKAIEFVISEFTEDTGLKLSDIRENTYKQVAKVVHPDSSTGDVKSFQVLQEIKEFFWSFDGQPRKEVKKVSWEHEQKVAQGYEYNFMKDCYYKK